jgi:hypothetical protein
MRMALAACRQGGFAAFSARGEFDFFELLSPIKEKEARPSSTCFFFYRII